MIPSLFDQLTRKPSPIEPIQSGVSEMTIAKVLSCVSTLPITYKQLTEATGFSTTAVTQAMRQLHKRGQIRKHGTRVANTNAWVLA